MDPTALIAAILSLIASSVAIVVAFRAAYRIERSLAQTRPEPSRDERIQWARGHIEACKGAELALELHREELPAALLLAQYRVHAARAKHELRALGVEA
jgi:hypothetical protein